MLVNCCAYRGVPFRSTVFPSKMPLLNTYSLYPYCRSYSTFPSLVRPTLNFFILAFPLVAAYLSKTTKVKIACLPGFQCRYLSPSNDPHLYHWICQPLVQQFGMDKLFLLTNMRILLIRLVQKIEGRVFE